MWVGIASRGSCNWTSLVDGRPPGASFWSHGEAPTSCADCQGDAAFPDIYDGGNTECCVGQMESGTWMSVTCNTELPFFCGGLDLCRECDGCFGSEALLETGNHSCWDCSGAFCDIARDDGCVIAWCGGVGEPAALSRNGGSALCSVQFGPRHLHDDLHGLARS